MIPAYPKYCISGHVQHETGNKERVIYGSNLVAQRQLPGLFQLRFLAPRSKQ